MDLDKLAKPFLKSVKPYTPGKPIEQLQREKGIEGPIAKLASNENPYPPHDRIKQAVIEALNRVNRYPESGAPELTAKLAGRHGVETNEVFVANGTNEILDLLIRAYVTPQQNVVFSELSFIIYMLICKQCGVAFTEVPAREYTHDLEAMADAVDDDTRLVFVCNPSNPTGTYNTAEEIGRFVDRLPDHLLVVIDEAYYEFVRVADYPDSMSLRKKHENLVVLRTFSKFYSLAGIRLGYAVADPRVVDILHKMRQPFNVNRLAQAAASAALDCSEDLTGFVDETVAERDAMRKRLLELGCEVPPSQTNFLFVVPPKSYSGDLCGQLEMQGVIVRPQPLPGLPPNVFRVNTGTPEENRRFLDAFAELLGSA
jgi:histidinol-phosphate aminotransferase